MSWWRPTKPKNAKPRPTTQAPKGNRRPFGGAK